MDDIVYGDGVEVYHSLYEMKIPEKSLGESVIFALCWIRVELKLGTIIWCFFQSS